MLLHMSEKQKNQTIHQQYPTLELQPKTLQKNPVELVMFFVKTKTQGKQE